MSNLHDEYKKADQELRIKRSIIGCVLSVVLVPAGGTVDWFLYHDFLQQFFWLRILCSSLIFFVLTLHYTEIGKRHIRCIMFLWVILLQILLCFMIFITDKQYSTYYASLDIVILAVAIIIPFSVSEMVLLCITTLIFSLISVLTFPLKDFGILYNNVYFIILTSIVSITASYFNSKYRFREFCLNYELEKNNQKLATLDKIKSQFFANVSHEFRTPLTLILAPAQDVLQNADSLSSKVKSSVEIINKNALRLLKLVNDLLDVMKLEEGKSDIKLQKLEVNNLVAGLADAMSHLARTKEIKIIKNIVTKDLFIAADFDAMEKIILNLLGNAIKFTDENGEIKVSTTLIKQEVLIVIEDNGIGISKEDLPYIFDRFKQVDSSNTRKYQGTGLGLALVKELVTLQNGRVEVESVVHKGTIFKLFFPRIISENINILDEESDDSDISQMTKMARRVMPEVSKTEVDYNFNIVNREAKTVLVAEDEPDMSSYISNLLKNEGYNVIRAKDGKMALELASRFSPDLIILDLMLPEIDGLLICEKLKLDDKTKFIKIIMVTARSDEKAKLTAFKNGVDDFLNKPFSSAELKARINNILKSDKLQKDLYRELRSAVDKLTLAQNRLIQSEKLNIMGRLPEEIAQGVKNPLNYMVTALYSMKMDPAVNSDSDLIDIIKDVEEGVKRIDDIVSDIRSFADFSEVDKTKFLFKEVVEDALKFLEHELEKIKVDLDVDNKLYVIASKNHITQVLINLISNAIKAINKSDNKNSGKLVISCKQTENKAIIEVIDNGIGIRNEDLKVIFNPFFTTKDISSGIGLGLNISYMIVKNHNSELKVDSEFKRGSNFYFELPIW